MPALIDAQFAALAHPTRRAILRFASEREMTAGALANAFSVSRPAVSQHIRVLVNAQLLQERRDQQRRFYGADMAGVRALRGAFDALWATSLARLKSVVEADLAALTAKPGVSRRRARVKRRRERGG